MSNYKVQPNYNSRSNVKKGCSSNSNNCSILVSTASTIGGSRDTGPWVVNNNGEVRFVAGENLGVTSSTQDNVIYVEYVQLPPPQPEIYAFSINLQTAFHPINYNGPLLSTEWNNPLLVGDSISYDQNGVITLNEGIWRLSLSYTISATSPFLTSFSPSDYLGLDVKSIGNNPTVYLSGSYDKQITNVDPNSYIINSTVTSTVTDIAMFSSPTSLIVAVHSNNITEGGINLGVSVDEGNTKGVVFCGYRIGDVPEV